MIKTFILAVVIWILGGDVSARDPVSLEVALNDSQYWPARVRTSETVQLPNGETLRKGWTGVLIRAEAGKLLVDFGRYGVNELDPDKTNFLEAAQKSPDFLAGPEDGNLVNMIGSRVFTVNDESVQPSQIRWADDATRILIAYLRESDLRNAEIVRTLQAIDERSGAEPIAVLVIPRPEESPSLDFAIEIPTGLATIPPRFAASYTVALHHLDSDTPLPHFVLTDRNGKVFARLPFESLKTLSPRKSTVEASK